MRNLLMVLLCLGLAGCATTPLNFNNLSLGMTKPDVIKIVGTPSSISAKGSIEYLRYATQPKMVETDVNKYPEYFVRLVNGKVESYGKVGDFDSAKNPTLDLNTNVNGSGNKL